MKATIHGDNMEHLTLTEWEKDTWKAINDIISLTQHEFAKLLDADYWEVQTDICILKLNYQLAEKAINDVLYLYPIWQVKDIVESQKKSLKIDKYKEEDKMRVEMIIKVWEDILADNEKLWND